MGKLVTQGWPFADEYKGKRFLRCDNYVKDRADNCRYRTNPEGFKERPSGGRGRSPSGLRKGVLKGGIVRKDGPNKGRPFVMCSEVDRTKPDGCQHFEWKDATPCPACNKAMLRRGRSRPTRPTRAAPS